MATFSVTAIENGVHQTPHLATNAAGHIVIAAAVQVRAPAEFQGTVIGDLNRRKGLIQNSEGEDDDVVLVAQVSSTSGISFDARVWHDSAASSLGIGPWLGCHEAAGAILRPILVSPWCWAHLKHSQTTGHAQVPGALSLSDSRITAAREGLLCPVLAHQIAPIYLIQLWLGIGP